MGAAAKAVLVVEDNPSVRGYLVKNLKQHGFQATGVSNVNDTRKLVNEGEQQFDVAVLDIHLQDPDFPSSTGIDLGYEIREAQPDLPPEILVFSGNYQPQHYDAAMRLGISGYIRKDAPEAEDIISHIGTLALLRALNPIRKEIGEGLARIAEEDWDTITAVKNLCSQIIKPEVEACLGVPSIFLLSDNKGTQNLTGDAGLPEAYEPAYAQIQNLIFNNGHDNGPFLFDEDAIAATDPAAHDIFQKLEGSAFIPLTTESENLRLSIGILRPDETDALRMEKDPHKLARILKPDLHQPVSKLLKYLSRIEAAIEKAKESAKKKILLDHTSRFCLYVGQIQMDVLKESVEKKEIESSNECFQKLKKLAVDLHATGNELSRLKVPRTRAAEKISVRAVVARARQMMQEQHLLEGVEFEEEGEDFELAIEEKDLLLPTLRMLQWMAQRKKLPSGMPKQIIKVAYERQPGRLAIHFTDQSRPLSDQLRERLFDPFTQATATAVDINNEEEPLGLYLPLYLAKMFIEVNNGLLEDKTKKESEHGHHFVISFAADDDKNPDTETTG